MWVPFAFFAWGARDALWSLSTHKATGLGALAGALAEALVMFGVAAVVVFQAVAIALLVREIVGRRAGHALAAIVSIAFSALQLFLIVLFFVLLGVTRRPG